MCTESDAASGDLLAAAAIIAFYNIVSHIYISLLSVVVKFSEDETRKRLYLSSYFSPAYSFKYMSLKCFIKIS